MRGAAEFSVEWRVGWLSTLGVREKGSGGHPRFVDIHDYHWRWAAEILSIGR